MATSPELQDIRDTQRTKTLISFPKLLVSGRGQGRSLQALHSKGLIQTKTYNKRPANKRRRRTRICVHFLEGGDHHTLHTIGRAMAMEMAA
jgi:hypothetical protein